MSCPKTQHLMTEYFADDLSAVMREEIDRHLAGCATCRGELEVLLATRRELAGWRDERVPHWDRGLAQFRRDHVAVARGGSLWQWLPTSLSFAMLALVVFNVSISSGESGLSIRFGGGPDSPGVAVIEQRLADFEADQTRRQNQEMQAFLARMDERQDSNNLRLMQAVMDQAGQITSENFEQMYTYFDQQRQQDLQAMQASYEQLVSSDYQTIQNVQQLANFVRFQGDIR